ncbi:hypothetical protein JAAARDRAFT_31553 [Jaapia argillacea MUCL 33604]|uniref:Major facilitator superfamily (MFS) profile domain-containing protein n=1 Tax=Jaapia argillacea MUCL 33604 TaxID=933084 RepID=A0A067QDA5_9AGAM|nr:hypothetical protein JAAARDRAFT_31553 [Jaapia argillacea MUCL 33604]
MSDATFSVVTSVFTVGGLVGSLTANLIMDARGRRGAIRASALATIAGSALMSVSGSVFAFVLGRILVGVGAGFGLCVGPIFIAEIAPTKIKGNVGVLTQLAIVIGILVTQSVGFRLATPTQWRLVLIFSLVLSLVQFFLSPLIVESPAWLHRKGTPQDTKTAARRLWGEHGGVGATAHASSSGEDVEDPLLPESEADLRRDEELHQATVSVPQLLKAPELRKPLVIVSLAMLSQQLSGINAVLYYSNAILSKSLPEFAPFVSLGITVVNAIMTFPPVFLIERVGRKKLMTLSAGGSIISLVAVGLGLDNALVSLSSVAIMTFVMSFAVGLGPVPFVIIPDVSPFHAVSALSSTALSLNWIANFVVGLIFLPLRNLLSGGSASREGRVFYVFAMILFLCYFALSRVYRG